MIKRSVWLVVVLVFILGCSKKELAVKENDGQDVAQLLEKGNSAFNQGDMEEALETYNIIYTRYPTSREYISAVLGMARTYNNLGDFENGFSLLYNLIRENMVPSRVPEIYNEMAKYYEVTAVYSKETGISGEAEDYRKAISYYQKAINYPNSDDVIAKSYAQFQVGELNVKLAQYDDAALAYQATALKFPKTEWAILAEQRMAQLRQAGQTTLSPLPQTKSPSETERTETAGQDSTGVEK